MSCYVEGVQKLDGLTPPDKACTTVVRANRAYNLEAASVIVACLGNPLVGHITDAKIALRVCPNAHGKKRQVNVPGELSLGMPEARIEKSFQPRLSSGR